MKTSEPRTVVSNLGVPSAAVLLVDLSLVPVLISTGAAAA